MDVRSKSKRKPKKLVKSIDTVKEYDMFNPLVSVIIPCFNHENFVREAIESVLHQTYSPIETIVVDDGSTDDSACLAERIDGVRVIRQANKGVAAARNTGFAASHGEYVLFLDSDDRLVPDAIRLSVEHATALASGADGPSPFVFGRFRRIATNGEVIRIQPPRSAFLNYRMLLRGDSVGPPGVALFPRSLVAAVCGFDPRLKLAEDLDFYFRICQLTDGYCHNAAMLEYRQHPGQSSYGVSRILKATLDVLESQREMIGNDPRLLAEQSAGQAAWSRLFGQWLPIEIFRHVKRGKISHALRASRQFYLHAPSTLLGAFDFVHARLTHRKIKKL